MRKILLTMLALFACVQLCVAQSCDQFINSVNGKKLVYDNLDAKGKPQGQAIFTTTKKDGSTVNYHSEMTDKNGKTISVNDAEVTCSGESINVDIRAFLPPQPGRQGPNMQAQATGKYLIYPLNVSPGQTLPDGSANIQITSNGNPFSEADINITNRKVDKQESVTTAAGTFDCLTISYDILVKARVMGIGIPVNMHATEWFAPKLGRPVKTETYKKGGKLVGTMQLASIN